MSLIPFGIPLPSLASGILDALANAIFVRTRNIGGLIADVTIREDQEDELIVTENPVEQGASVTDNSFKAPARLTVDVGYSNSNPTQFDPNYVQDVYSSFLAMQASREPITVVTGKRIYNNMVITLLHTVNDEKTENALFLTVRMREIILVDTQTVSVPSSQNMSNPQNNAATQSQGTQSLTYAGGTQGPVATNATAFNYQNAPFSAGFGTGG